MRTSAISPSVVGSPCPRAATGHRVTGTLLALFIGLLTVYGPLVQRRASAAPNPLGPRIEVSEAANEANGPDAPPEASGQSATPAESAEGSTAEQENPPEEDGAPKSPAESEEPEAEPAESGPPSSPAQTDEPKTLPDEPEEPAILPPPEDLDELRQIQKLLKQQSTELQGAVVGIRIGPSQGSGVIVSKQGLILTAGHVVGSPGRDATILFADGEKVDAKTLGLCRWADAGMIQITEEGDYPAVELGKSDDVKRGMWCIAMGHPLGFVPDRPPVVRVGRILQPQPHLIQSDCPIVAGDSGGPLFDLDGKLIGINSRISQKVDQNFHIAIEVFEEYWDAMAAGEVCGDSAPGRDSHDVRKAFHDSTEAGAQCVVRVKCDGRDVALGTIVGPNGWVVTKATQIDGKKVQCQFRRGTLWDAEVVGVDQQYDLAMLKVEAEDLPKIRWGDASKLAVGQWLSTLGPDHDYPFALGVVSVPRREIPRTPGVLGVVVEETDGGAKIADVIDDGPADDAGLRKGDVITHVNGKATDTRDKAVAAIKQHAPGETICVRIRRGKEVLNKRVRLGVFHGLSNDNREFQNESNIGLSERRDGFPVVLQHDGVVRPEHCGSPVVDLDGSAVGVNIARAGRVETYAIPTDILIPRLYELMSGRLDAAPLPSAEELEADAAPPDETPPDETPPDETPPDETPPETPESNDLEPKGPEPEDAKPDDAKPEEGKPRRAKPQEEPPKQPEPETAPPDGESEKEAPPATEEPAKPQQPNESSGAPSTDAHAVPPPKDGK